MKQRIVDEIDQLKTVFEEISIYIGENPELGHEEFKASKILSETLEDFGFDVEMETCDLPTAFRAVFDSGKAGPVIGFMAEYDALPEVGHACGHNLIGTMGIAAGIGLSKIISETGGKVVVYGTPAEETRGGKVTMAEAGLFNELDAALMVHPLNSYVKSGSSLAMDAIQFEFFGKSTHAAASPQDGINALDAVIQTFNSINAMRQHILPTARIHGIITEGGKAANVTPDYAAAQFYVRGTSREYVNELTEKVKKCAEGAALQTGASMKHSFYEFSYDDMITNMELSEAFTNELVSLGVDRGEIQEQRDGSGSLDMGNVSQFVPAIHPYIKITEGAYACHTHEFREAAMTDQAREAMIIGAKAMALTGCEVLTNRELLNEIKKEFALNRDSHAPEYVE
ncbi:M20 family metallopeptidase [Bacillus salacetis]|uniref:M20 family metallopeptidase n=1 Tax=Bacillus salacetis TaxID=2315464 RepID=UPI0014446321|nr:M20 family metallopeptidase [Bacillus salacetis]